jgi:aminoglycoside 2''-phosphotransferase
MEYLGLEMPDNTDALLQRVRAIMPALEIEQFEINPEGLINEVVIVNQKYVFRFARTEEYARILDIELKILDLIRSQIGISVPTPIYVSTDSMVYPLLGGQPLSRKMVLGFDESTQNHIAGQLGAFLYRLHTTEITGLDWEIPSTLAPVKRQDWTGIWQDVKDKIYPLIQIYQIEWAEDLFHSVLNDPQSSTWEPALIHGDLASYHILIDTQTRNITGVIDFGMAGVGDAASDIGGLISIYGETFVNRMHTSYPHLEKYIPRARFYSQLLELEWVLRGLKSGESFWFTAHLGGARDIHG